MASQSSDVLIIGGGMAGASAGYFLARDGLTVRVLEREEQPGYHSTGRSAALFSETYGPAAVRRLTTAGRPFLDHPPAGFAEVPLLTPRGLLMAVEPQDQAKIAELVAAAEANGARVQTLSGAEICDLIPIVREGVFVGGVLEPAAKDVDVDALHQGFLRGIKQAGGSLVCRAEVEAIGRDGDGWSVRTRAGDTFNAKTVINAAGAWAGEVAAIAGATPLTVIPKRRTAVMVDLPAGVSPKHWPMLVDAAESVYFKADAGRLLVSPSDATPVPPQDVQPEELDVAIAIDRFMQVTTLEVGRPGESWAGLRTFVPDGDPVCGFDPKAPGFFWLAGQGGYGIQTAPGLGLATAALVQGRDLPEAHLALGLTAADLAPDRPGIEDFKTGHVGSGGAPSED